MIERVSDNIVLVGTAHVSKKSVEEVRAAIGEFKPDIVGVELDTARYEALRDRARWQKTPVTDIIRSGRSYFFLAQLILASFQRKLAERYGVEPGAEMIEAVNCAARGNLKLALLDRDIGVTLKRAWRLMRLREKFAFGWEAYKIFLGFARFEELAEEEEKAKEKKSAEEAQKELEQLMDEDVLSQMMEEIGSFAPSVKRVLIDERDRYIAKKILLAARRGRIVAVVGAGHLRGIRAALEQGLERAPAFSELNEVPARKIPWGQAAAWSIPLLIFWIVIYQGLQGHLERAGQALALWWIIHGIGAGAGAADLIRVAISSDRRT